MEVLSEATDTVVAGIRHRVRSPFVTVGIARPGSSCCDGVFEGAALFVHCLVRRLGIEVYFHFVVVEEEIPYNAG